MQTGVRVNSIQVIKILHCLRYALFTHGELNITQMNDA